MDQDKERVAIDSETECQTVNKVMPVILVKKKDDGIFEGNSWGENEMDLFDLKEFEFVIKLEGGMFALTNKGAFVLDIPRFLNYETGKEALNLKFDNGTLIERVMFEIHSDRAFLNYSIISVQEEFSVYVKDVSIIKGRVELVEEFINGLNQVSRVYKFS